MASTHIATTARTGVMPILPKSTAKSACIIIFLTLSGAAGRVMERLDFPLITHDWTAREELALLDGLDTYGLGASPMVIHSRILFEEDALH
jgi:hypothetical protein